MKLWVSVLEVLLAFAIYYQLELIACPKKSKFYGANLDKKIPCKSHRNQQMDHALKGELEKVLHLLCLCSPILKLGCWRIAARAGDCLNSNSYLRLPFQ